MEKVFAFSRAHLLVGSLVNLRIALFGAARVIRTFLEFARPPQITDAGTVSQWPCLYPGGIAAGRWDLHRGPGEAHRRLRPGEFHVVIARAYRVFDGWAECRCGTCHCPRVRGLVINEVCNYVRFFTYRN